MSTEIDPKLAERFTLKAFVEACLVLEEGVAGVRDVDLGMMMGTGMIPGPFARADLRGLDDVLAALEQAEEDWGEHFEPPLILRRLVAQGRLGAKSGQGFYPYPKPEAGYEQAPVKLDRRGDVAVLWLDNPPANSLSPDVIGALETAWGDLEGSAKAMIVASPNPALFCAGADIKAFTKMDEATIIAFALPSTSAHAVSSPPITSGESELAGGLSSQSTATSPRRSSLTGACS